MPARLPRSTTALAAVAGLIASGLAAITLAPAAQAAQPTPSCDATTCSVTFGYTGAEQTFTPPAGVTTVRAVVAGAPGGDGGLNSVGGRGGLSQGTFALNASRLPLKVSVGEAGGLGTAATFGGGGGRGNGTSSLGGSGGGRSSLSDAAGPLLIAGGGGGAGGHGAATGGSGGGLTGGAGSRPSWGVPPEWVMSDAGGGTQTSGGAGATSTRTGANANTFPSGVSGDSTGMGNGGAGSAGTNGAGGGGGGFHGGGGGADSYMSGGGGSGYVAPSVSGSTQSGGSTSASIVISWDKTATATALSASPARATPGAAATLTATVTSAGGTPSGTVAFSDSGTPIIGCSAVALNAGIANCQTTFASGSRTLRATYAGSDGYASSAGDKAYTVISAPAITTTTLVDATFNAAYSQTLGASGGTAPYSFTKTIGSLPSGLTLSATGVISGTPGAAGTFTFTVRVTDSSSGTPQTADKSLTISVGKASTAIAGSADGTAHGNPVTYTATGLPSDATGNIQFSDDGTTLCTTTLPDLTCTDEGHLPAGDHILGTSYSGDENYAGSASTFSFSYSSADTTVGATASGDFTHSTTPNTLTVTGLAADATGDVNFTDQNGATLCTTTAQVGSCSPDSYLQSGNYDVSVAYAGDSNYNASPAAKAASFSVAKRAIEVFVQATPAVSTFGDAITFTQTAEFPADATGTVRYFAYYRNDNFDINYFCNATIDQPACSVAGLPVGTFSYTRVSYDGDSNYSFWASGNGNDITIAKADQSVDFTSAKPTPTVGGATYDPAASGTTHNPISYSVASEPADACTIDDDGTVAFIHAGTCTVTATQSGDDNHNEGTAEQVITIGKAKGSVGVTTTTPLPATVGDSYTPVAAAGPGSGTPALALYADSNTACALSEGTLSFVHSGTCAFLFTQAGGDDYTDASTAVTSFTVDKAEQPLLVTSSPPSTGIVSGEHDLVVTGGKSSSPVLVAVGEGTTNSACSLGTLATSVTDSGLQQANAKITYERIGTCSIVLQQDGDADHDAATSSVTITVGGLATSTSLTLSSDTVVHGQPVTATATVIGAGDGRVVFRVDGDYYDSQPRGVDGTATSRNLAAAVQLKDRHISGRLPTGLPVGGHMVTAQFVPADANTYATSETNGSALTVGPATTTTKIKVNAKTLVATVSVDAPSTDTPTGSVTFLVGGKEVGTAPIVDGVATLDYAAPAGRAVAATYSGRGDANENTEVSSSSASTARSNPTVTARVTSSKGKSKAGWYSRPVTIRFTCRAGSDAVTACPTAVTVGRNGITTVKRTVLTKDGGVATINVTVKVDRSRPTVKITGIKAGGIYGALPSTRCAASDKVSGVASCRVVHKAKGSKIKYTAVATDRAGNTTKKTVTVRRSPALITGAKYGGTLPVVKLGKGYLLIVTGKARPSYVYAAPSPARPTGNGGPFTKIGKNRWAYSVVFTKNLRGHSTWSFGVKTGKKTVTVKVRVKR